MSNFVKIDQVSWCFIWLCPKVHLFVTMCAQCSILPFIKSLIQTSILTPNSILNFERQKLVSRLDRAGSTNHASKKEFSSSY